MCTTSNSRRAFAFLALFVLGLTLARPGTAAAAGNYAYPVGPAAGSLTGTYPNPTLATVNANVGTVGDASHVSQLTLNAQGLATAAGAVAILLSNGNLSSGLYGNILGIGAINLSATTVSGLLALANLTPSGTNGQVLTTTGGVAVWTTPSVTTVTGTGLWYSAAGTLNGAAVGLSGDATLGALSGANVPITLATVNSNVGTFGDASHVSQLTLNAKGLTTAASAVSILLGNANLGAGAYPNITGVGTLTSGATGAGFTVAIGSSTFTGAHAVANGGTGLATLTAHAAVLGEGTSNVAFAPPGSAGTVLVSGGVTSDPTFGTLTNSSLAAGAFANITGVGTLTSGSLGTGFAVNLGLPTFSGTLPLLDQAAPTGSGFTHITSGAWDSAARALLAADLPSVSLAGDVACSGSGGALTGCNVASISGSSPIAITPNSLQWLSTATAPLITQATQTSDVLAVNLTLQPMAPFGSATGAHTVPGFLVFNAPSPSSGNYTNAVSYRTNNTEYLSVYPNGATGTTNVALKTSGTMTLTAGSMTLQSVAGGQLALGGNNTISASASTRFTDLSALYGLSILNAQTSGLSFPFNDVAAISFTQVPVATAGTLVGTFGVTNGSATVSCTSNQVNAIVPGTPITFTGTGTGTYTVATITGGGSFTITPVYASTTAAAAGATSAALAGTPWNITAEAGEAATGAGNNGGNGGPLNLFAGAGGTSGSATAGAGGVLTLAGGSVQFLDRTTQTFGYVFTPAAASTLAWNSLDTSIAESQTALTSTSAGNGTVGAPWSRTGQAGQAASGATHNGGAGAAMSLTGGAGGASALQQAGNGGANTIAGGIGGAAAGASQAGGLGGAASVLGGAGGAAGAGGPGGTGGTASLIGGASGVGNTQGGQAVVSSGAGSGTGPPGAVTLNAGTQTVIQIGGITGLGFASTTTALTSGTTTFSATALLTPYLKFTGTLTGAVTLNFGGGLGTPGVWFLDFSAVTLASIGTFGITIINGSGSVVATTLITAFKTILTVGVTGLNVISVGLNDTPANDNATPSAKAS